MSAFLIVERFPTFLFVAAVDKVELIPVDLSVRLVGRPVLAKCFPLFEQEILVRHVVFVRIAARAVASPHVAHARGEVLIIVRSRIVSIAIPSQRRPAVERIGVAQVRSQSRVVVVAVPVPREDTCGSEGAHHARIAFFAVLVTPVWVVVVRVGQPIGLFCRSRLLRAFGRRAVGHERKRMVRAEALFRSEEISCRIVERTLDLPFFRSPITHRGSERPTVGHESRGVGEECASHIIAVGGREAQFLALGKLRSTGVVARCAADARSAEGGKVIGIQPLAVACGVIETTDRGIVEAPQLQVVESQPVHIGVGIHIVVGPHPETHRAEAESDVVEKRIAFGRDR